MSHEIVDKLIEENKNLKTRLDIHENIAVQLTNTIGELTQSLAQAKAKIEILEGDTKIVKIQNSDDTYVSVDDIFCLRRKDKKEIERLTQLLNG
jgi:hypothetical protein